MYKCTESDFTYPLRNLRDLTRSSTNWQYYW